MTQKIALGLLWLGFGIYAFGFAPPNSPETWTLIQNLSTGQFAGINPLIITLFNIMGVLPLLYSCLMYSDGHGQKLPAWVFVAASFAVGAFALLPYLMLRRPNPTWSGPKNNWIKFWDARLTGGAIALAAIALVLYGVVAGDWQNFVHQWQTNRFIHVMSLDFCLTCLLFPTLLGDDMTRRGWSDRRIFWAVSLLPLFGPAIYVMLRPPLPDAVASPANPAIANFP